MASNEGLGSKRTSAAWSAETECVAAATHASRYNYSTIPSFHVSCLKRQTLNYNITHMKSSLIRIGGLLLAIGLIGTFVNLPSDKPTSWTEMTNNGVSAGMFMTVAAIGLFGLILSLFIRAGKS